MGVIEYIKRGAQVIYQVASNITLFPEPLTYETIRLEDTMKAIGRDWQRVGDDLRAVIVKLELESDQPQE